MGLRKWWGKAKRQEEAYLLALSAIRDVAIASAEAQEAQAHAVRRLIEQQIGMTAGQQAEVREDGEAYRLRKLLEEESGGDELRRQVLRRASTLNELDFS